MKKRSFIGGAFILATAGIVSKFIGFFFRVPLTNMIGAEGYGLYNYPYNLYSAMLAISVTGLPIAISKLVSGKIAINRYDEAHRIFKIALCIMLFLGSFTSLALYVGSEFLVNTIWPKEAYYPLMGLVIAPFFVALMSVFRGYFQGMQIMVASSISQVFESFGRLIFGLGLAYALLDRGIEYAAGGGTFGATAGAFIGLCVIILYYLRVKPQIKEKIEKQDKGSEKDATVKIIKDILYLSIPISIGSLAGTLMPLIDSLMIKIRLDVAGFSEEMSTILFGRLGAGTTLINFPLTISTAIAISLVPAISEAHAKGLFSEIGKRLETGIKIGLYLVFPAFVGLFVFAQPILNFIFPTIKNADYILRFLSIALIFMTLNQILTATIQGVGRPIIAVRNLFIGAGVKVVLSYYLVAIPSININGAIIGTLIGYFIASLLNYLYLKRKINFAIHKIDLIFKPLVASIVMGGGGYYYYHFMMDFTSKNSISLLSSIVVSGVIYGLLLLLLGALSLKEIILFIKKRIIKNKK